MASRTLRPSGDHDSVTMPFALTVDPTSPEGLGTEPARAMLIPSSQILEEPGLGTILGAVRAEREITGQKPSISAIFGCQFPAYQIARARARERQVFRAR